MTNIFKRYEGKWPLIISFSLFYTLVVLVISLLFRFLPTGVSLESQLFDQVQKKITIDSKGDWLYDRYQPYLEELSLINLDSVFFDTESNRIKKDKLAQLLAKINDQKTTPKIIFIDYANTKKDFSDSLLHTEFAKLGDKLVLPFSFDIKGAMARKGEASLIQESRMTNLQFPLHQGAKQGFVFPLTDPYTYSNRYFKYKTDDGKYHSVPWLLYQQSSFFDQKYADNFVNDVKEFKFILRNEEVYQKERAVHLYDGKHIINGEMPGDFLKELLNEKIIIIGLFEDYRTKYNRTIDKFLTPVQANMSGSLLLVNAYLNLPSKTELKHHNWFIFFLINFFIGFSIAINYEKNIRSRYVAFVTLSINLVASVILFNVISLLLYVYWSTQISLGIALLLYQKKYYLFSWFQGWYTDKYVIADEDEGT